MRGKCIEPGDGFVVRCEDENRGEVATVVLPSLPLKVGIKFRNATAKSYSVMIRSKRLNPIFDLTDFSDHYFPARSL